MSVNFDFLKAHDPLLVKLAGQAEKYFADDPNTCLIKLRQFTESLCQQLAARAGLLTSTQEELLSLINALQNRGVINAQVANLFHGLRKAGNDAVHKNKGNHTEALHQMRMAHQLAIVAHRAFGAGAAFKAMPFIPPPEPNKQNEALTKEIERLNKELATSIAAAAEDQARLRAEAETAAQQYQANLSLAQAQAAEKEAQFTAEREQFNQRLTAMQAVSQAAPPQQIQQFVQQTFSETEKLELDENATRRLIDKQLQDVGWLADTETINYRKGTSPEKNKNLAIAEWPTETGPADYVLFVGLTPIATIEAKRKNLDVSASLQQAKRYSRSFKPSPETVLHSHNWGAEREFRIPFAFSANGRPFLRQIATKSGIWFCDLRKPENLSRPLDGFYSPEGLIALLKCDEGRAHEQLQHEPFNYGFTLRHYQQAAIQSVESAIAAGQRSMLLAMATGTGKTKTCIALIYRLLKAQRFRRVLFLVDRSALGEQAANAFKDTRMESLQTFADIFGIKELNEQKPDSDTAVHVATVQGMVQRALYAGEDATPPSVDQYDCIIVDECHRGYLMDRELSDTELLFRSYDDYISKYRRVLDYFDAVKIGLTATPALHTTQIFGTPIYTYSYREAVIDGYLVDYEPPVQIKTELSTSGIVWQKGEQVSVYQAEQQQLELFTTPDEIKIEIEGFNRKVITESFNKVVCEFLAQELDPSAQQKTLIFCVNDAHADMVVHLLKQAFTDQYGSIDDDAVIKITGTADKPLQLIRRYKNERNPNVAVTVDLLTTGVDVPEICNLVFLRRVNSRILFDQMLGRATRLCSDIGKETFRIFDAVRIYEALHDMTAMKPVVVNPSISFSQLAQELVQVTGDTERALVRDQFVAKLRRQQRHLSEATSQDFEARAGMPPSAFIDKLKAMPLTEIAPWFTQNPDLGEILDRKGQGRAAPLFVSHHEDKLLAAERGYGQAQRPEDYLQEFSEFLRTRGNQIPALVTVLTRPRELTRKQLRELALELDRAGFSEASLATAWREMTNQDIAAHIVGYIRQAAIGDPLVAYDQRVDKALQKILASRTWSTPQRQWLQTIAKQTKANLLVDREAFDDPNLVFKREGGGFNRLDKIFNGELEQVLSNFNESIWAPVA